MIFMFRAAFWTLVVAAFIPAGFYVPEDGAFARQAGAVAHTTLERADTGALNTAAACEGREQLCETAGELARFAGWAASMAADTAESAYQDYTASRETIDQARAAPRTVDDVFAAAAGEPAAR